jgi:LPXTG-motif cell wall-anchored protein
VDSEGEGIFAEALTVNGIVPPKPLLPATGSEIGVVPVALVGLLALLVGGALLGRRRARV